MEELAKQTQPILQKLGDFFDIFDLSFIVSGIATGLSILFIYHNLTDEEILKSISELNGYLIFLSIIIAYLLGLISWVLGKAIRNLFPEISYLSIETLFKANNAENDELYKKYKSYFTESKTNSEDSKKNKLKEQEAMRQLYCMLWVKVRENNKALNSFSLLKRYWVQTATFEGLLFSIVSWSTAFAISLINDPICNEKLYIPIFIAIILVFIVVYKEAINYKKYQMTELVLTYLCYN
ncbi:hypothetical protein [Flavobacterium koreense]